MLTSKRIIETLSSVIQETAPLTKDQEDLEQELVTSLISAIHNVTDTIWKFKLNTKYLKDNLGKNITGVWIQVSRTPPPHIPKLYEFIDFKVYFDFTSPCYLYYAYGRDRGEFKSKTFKSNSSKIRRGLINVFKSLYFESDKKTPRLASVVDISKLKK